MTKELLQSSSARKAALWSGSQERTWSKLISTNAAYSFEEPAVQSFISKLFGDNVNEAQLSRSFAESLRKKMALIDCSNITRDRQEEELEEATDIYEARAALLAAHNTGLGEDGNKAVLASFLI